MSRVFFLFVSPIVALFVLHSAPQAEYVNAGVLPYSTTSGEIRVLLGFDGERESWSDFVGVCGPGESPAQTAAREFVEETRGAFGRDDVDRRLEGAVPVEVGPTRIFLMEVPEISAQQISRLTKSRNSEKTGYCWVALIDLLQSIDDRGANRARVPASCGADSAELFNLVGMNLQQGQELRQRLLAPPDAPQPTRGPLESPRCGR